MAGTLSLSDGGDYKGLHQMREGAEEAVQRQEIQVENQA
jgi:hypothetical protein